MRRFAGCLLGLGLALSTCGVALAHTEAGALQGLSHGLSHPFMGLDHVLAMLAVGVLAARLGGKAGWVIPLAFMTAMSLGGVLAVGAITLPYHEAGLAASVITFGLLIASRMCMGCGLVAGLAGAFAVFHGYAHGIEMPLDGGYGAYAAGFMLATALIHGAGFALGRWISPSLRLTHLSGGAMASIGLLIAVGLI